MADLSARDVERAQFVFDIYDFEGNGTCDAVNLGDMLRALNQNPTLALIEKLGGTKKKNEKKLKLDEFLPMYSQVKKEKEQGTFEDFLECLKLYDKEENGKMMAAELSHILLSLGERLTDDECKVLLDDCMEEPDDEGQIPFEPLLNRLYGTSHKKLSRTHITENQVLSLNDYIYTFKQLCSVGPRQPL